MIPCVECPHCHSQANTTGGSRVLCPTCLQEFVPPAGARLQGPTATRLSARLLFVLVVGLGIGVVLSHRVRPAHIPIAKAAPFKSAVRVRPLPPAQSVVELRDVELWDAYQADVAVADRKYKGKTLSYKLTEHPTLVRLAGHLVFTTPLTACRFGADKAAKVSGLAIGVVPQIRGVCQGRVAAPTSPRGWVVAFDDCDIVTDP
jgi:hypothetical protein